MNSQLLSPLYDCGAAERCSNIFPLGGRAGARTRELGGERRFPFGGSATLARQPFSPRSGCCVSTMDRDRAPHTGSCRAWRSW